MKKALIAMVAASLIGLGPVPLSACAVSSSKLAECATPATQSHCDGMNMDDGGTRVAAVPDGSCCSFASAPVSARGQKAPEQGSLIALPITVVHVVLQLPRVAHDRAAEIEDDISPPPLQSFLCTFLI